MASADRYANALGLGGAVLAAWLFLGRYPYHLVFIAAASIPLGALAWLRQSPEFLQNGSNGKLGLMFVAIPASLALSPPAQILLEWNDIIPAAIFMACAATAVHVLFPSIRRDDNLLIGASAFAAIYGFGVLNYLNVQLDSGRPEERRASYVFEAFKKYGVEYYAYDSRRIAISKAEYLAAKDGDLDICIETHSGALGIKWVGTRTCPTRALKY
jgi:hypothetical protein